MNSLYVGDKRVCILCGASNGLHLEDCPIYWLEWHANLDEHLEFRLGEDKNMYAVFTGVHKEYDDD